MIRFAAVVLMLFCLTACGRKGALIAPEALVPAKIKDFTVVQKGEELQLSWSLPKRLESGGKLTDLAGFKLLAREMSLGAGCPDCPESWRLLKQFDLEYLKGATSLGDRLFYRDLEAKQGIGYHYRLIAFTKGAAESAPAEARFTKQPPLPAPVLKTTATTSSVTLECSAVALPAGYLPTGCAIYRAKQGESAPLTPYARLANFGKYEDTLLEPGVTYLYQATQTATVNGYSFEGVPATASAKLAEPD
ncbi:fibronectin type III domain-containing protein [Geobacter pelophilus]|uniref:Fibronectin type III domain-containing protein n=1 Tax=Geoanaerobacter pelophilus TaxID=60036 RepID=A0AAW4L6L8_9BACT|nr:fibronectin type III domain-containing protein [Geoanaerobacter pelophilus]MBT0664225.1 fibronectin type III domain-containing protein [Geoanaerobacter pelophilus]